MNEPIIEIRDVGKKYNIYHQREKYLSLRDLMTQFFTSPFKTIKEKMTREEFWSLRNISVDIARGETVGIIGANGAGKSTLLKILSKITPPTEGEIIIRGKVASLLEVGTGFHPELTGRENIYLNGAILGMTKKEIQQKFDSIVEFSGVEKFLDTPVKRYSSGMYVRLAFSVAAHLEPDVLIVDEVLSVGDAEFQKKCLNKMNTVVSEDGRTVIFVSHNMNAIKKICQKCILLKNGEIIAYGDTLSIIAQYNKSDNKNIQAVHEYKISESKAASITSIKFFNNNNVIASEINVDEGFYIDIEYHVQEEVQRACICALFYDQGDDLFLLSSETDKTLRLRNYKKGRYITRIAVPAQLFNIGKYHCDISFQKPFIEYIDHKQKVSFSIVDSANFRIDSRWKRLGRTATVLDYLTSKK